jgi:hypothetical protein
MTNKDEVVSILLAIRAGLSVISKENYKAKKLLEMADEINEELLQKAQLKGYDLTSDNDEAQTKTCIEKTESEAVRHALFHINSGLTLALALENTFDNYISILEWERLDLIIYYLNSNMAQSLDEAIKLINKDRQSGVIDTKDDEALVAVNNLIASKAENLGESFNILTGGIYEQLNITPSEYEEIKHRTASYAYVNMEHLYITDITSQKNLANNLKEYSLTSSYELFDDVRELKNNSELLSWKKNIAME